MNSTHLNLFSHTQPLSRDRPPIGAMVVGLSLVGLMVAYCLQLWPEWRHNPDLSHGFFAPLIFVLLVKESRRLGPWRWVRPGAGSLALLGASLFGGFGLFALAGLFAASLAWSHALVLFLLGGALSGFLLAGLVVLADERLRLLPFNWVNLTALFLWILVAPVPDGTYARLTLGLQGLVTDGVMNVLQLLAVPARQHGNVIELARTSVGVEEACSGVRSLISCTFAGFFFAAWMVRRPGRRLFLILVAPALALTMNFLRSLTLTLLTNADVDITGTWHDVTGFAILAVTALFLAGLAMLLESKDALIPPAPPTSPEPAASLAGPYRLFFGGSLLTLGLAAFFLMHARPAVSAGTKIPDLGAMLPAEAPGWQVATPRELYQFSSILQTTHLLERTYVRTLDNGQPLALTVYLAYWPPGQASVSLVASHTPDACWPGAGWNPRPTPEGHTQSIGPGFSPAEYRLFKTDDGHAQYVWFWHVFDGRVIDHRDPYSLPALLRSAVQYGFRRQGSQYFVRISSNRPWNDLAGEPLLREILAHLDSIGL